MSDEAKTIGTRVEIRSRDGVIDAHLFRPAGEGAWPAVLMLTDVHGTRAVYEAMGHRLAGYGYVVLLPNVYYRGGPAPLWDQSLPRNDKGVEARRGELRAMLTPDAIVSDMTAELDYLAGLDHVRGSQAGVVGYCMAGSFALRAASDLPERVAAAAAFHGGRLATDEADSPHLGAPKVKGRLYFGHADQDASIPPEMIARLDAALSEAGVSFRSELYEGAHHGYAVADVPAYNEAAAERHWRTMIELFGATLAA